jgi:hypothetical protein
LARAEAGLAKKRAGFGQALHAPSTVALLAGRPGLLDESRDLPALVLPERSALAGAGLPRERGGARLTMDDGKPSSSR